MTPEELENQQAEKKDQSAIFGVSVRAWLSLIIVGTVCAQQLSVAISNVMRGDSVMIEEPLYGMVMMTLGFYFGQKTK